MNKRVRKECESTVDYILPDYMGDIRKILSATARALPAGSFFSDGVLEASGAVEYEVLYTDSDGRLTAINTSSDYSAKASVKDGTYEGAYVDPTVSSVSVRVTGPRKITLKAGVENDVYLTLGSSCDISEEEESENRECTYVMTKGERYVYSRAQEREYAEEGERLVGMAGEEIEIISSGAEVVITESLVKDGGVELRGEINAYAIIRAPMQPPFRISKTIPFSELIEMDENIDGAALTPRARVTSTVVGSNDDGDDKQLVFNLVCEFSCIGVGCDEKRVISDLYLTDCEVENTYKEIECTSLVTSATSSVEVCSSVNRESLGLVNVGHMIHTSCDVCEIEAKQTETGVQISAIAHLSGVACEINADGSVDYVPVKTSAKIEHNVNKTFQNSQNIRPICKIKARSADAVIAPEEITLSAVCDVELSLLQTERIRCLASFEKRDPIKTYSSEITVYYPTSADTLYSVGKRFHISVAKLIEDNSLTASAAGMTDEGIEAKKLFIIK
ncbi:MAG: DUF3794 domain-containing protein [Clostridia bacterium]|nr:DUF3794 domain-containing protein [Clostridia bacterium]